MTTDELIARLARDAGPVPTLPPPEVRLVLWLPVAAASIVAGVWIFGVRSDRATMLTSPGFVRDGLLALFVMVFGAAVALRTSVPGVERRPVGRLSVAAAVVVWLVTAGTATVAAGQLVVGGHWAICVVRAVSVGLVPGALLFVSARRGMVLRPAWTFGLAAASAMAAGALVVQLACPIGDAGHVLLGHVAPVAAAGLVTAVLARPRR